MKNQENLIDRLPFVKGSYRELSDLSKINWFRVGGKAEVLFRPADIDDLQYFLKNKPKDVPVTPIGVGSNLLVRKGGIRGVVIRLGRGFSEIKVVGDIVVAGAAALSPNVARTCMIEDENGMGIEGMEFLSGIPGTIGGALAMNAGCYGREVMDILVEAEAVDEKGKMHKIKCEDMGFSYRCNSISPGWIFTGAVFKGKKAPVHLVEDKIREMSKHRHDTQPDGAGTSGSTFKNPDQSVCEGKKAWQLIDEAGCRGLQIGGAKVSEKHCNFFMNTGNATADDIEKLGAEVSRRVREKFGITLEWEIRKIGDEK